MTHGRRQLLRAVDLLVLTVIGAPALGFWAYLNPQNQVIAFAIEVTLIVLLGYFVGSGIQRARREVRIRIGSPVCGRCGYSLTGAVSERCPECGRTHEGLHNSVFETRFQIHKARAQGALYLVLAVVGILSAIALGSSGNLFRAFLPAALVYFAGPVALLFVSGWIGGIAVEWIRFGKSSP